MEPKRPKTTPVAIRVTAEERASLVAAAGNRSLGDFIRGKLFDGEAKLRKAAVPKPDTRQLAHILALLGKSDIPASLRGLAAAAQIGALPVEPETEQAIQNACNATVDIRRILMRALGLAEPNRS